MLLAPGEGEFQVQELVPTGEELVVFNGAGLCLKLSHVSLLRFLIRPLLSTFYTVTKMWLECHCGSPAGGQPWHDFGVLAPRT